MLFQPTNIVPDEVSGQGCVDITDDLEVSWQVNGDSAMTAYQITICENNASSTQGFPQGLSTFQSRFGGETLTGTFKDLPLQ